MTYNETAAIVYRIISAYPSQSRLISKEMIADMVREWHQSLSSIPPDGVMEAVTGLMSESKWMPTLSEVITKVLDVQYGTNSDIIRALDRAVAGASNCIIFGQVTEEQERGYEKLTPFQKLIIHSPYEFNRWLQKDHEWKEERVMRIKREISYGRHSDYLSGRQQEHLGSGFNVLKALEERKKGVDA